MKKYLVYSLCFILFLSCVEEFKLDLDKVQQRLVIEGLVENNTGPHYVRVTKSSTGAFIKNNYLDVDENVEIIDDATVIISDNTGQTEQLTLVPENSNDEVVFNKGGYYKTTNFIGEPNRTYTLTVTTKEGKIYTASDYMNPPPIINSLSYELRVSEKDGQEYYVPLLSFFEPQETEDYYLVNQNFERANTYSISNWEFEVLSDIHLNSGNIEVFLDNGASPQDFGYYYYFIGDEINVKTSSITKETYEYFKFLLEQFKQDGGVFNPTPASPPTNISNNGLGFFQASSYIKSKKIIE